MLADVIRLFIDQASALINRPSRNLSAYARTPDIRMDGVRFDSQRFPDAMGWRAKFGVLTPAPNTIVENEMHEMAPPGVINIVNRYYVPNQEVRSDDDWRLIMAHTRANVANAVDGLVQGQPGVVDHIEIGLHPHRHAPSIGKANQRGGAAGALV